MQASFFYFIYAVDHQNRNHGGCASDVVRQDSLHAETGEILTSVSDVERRKIVPTPARQKRTLLRTSPILTGVATGLGMHGSGQRSRHSG